MLLKQIGMSEVRIAMEKEYIMLKDTPVLEIEHYNCRILNYDLLPISLRYSGVNYDDVMHGWTENRTMNIGKTNAKDF